MSFNNSVLFASHGTDDFVHPVQCDENGFLIVSNLAPSGNTDVNLNDGSGNPISSNSGALDVNIVSGGSGGGLVQIQGSDGTNYIDISCSPTGILNTSDSNIPSNLTVENNKLLVDTGIINNVNLINNQPYIYDLNIFNAQLYADSCNTASIDPLGRQGWSWTNDIGGETAVSNLYWYSNAPNSVSTQADVSKLNMNCYTILNIDSVVNSRCLPYLVMYSKPTGSGDAGPFYHSRWTYQINTTTNKLYAGESVMFVIGDSSLFADIAPQTRRINLELTATNGEGLPSEIILFITLNTDATVDTEKNEQAYLIQYAGFCNTADNNYNQVKFTNSLEKQSLINNGSTNDGVLCQLKNIGTTTGALNVFDNECNITLTNINNKIPADLTVSNNRLLVDTGATITGNALDVNVVSGGSGGGLVQIQGYNGVDWENISASMGNLAVSDYKIYNATTVDTEAIKVYTVNSSSSTVQAVKVDAPTEPININALSYVDSSSYTHNILETGSILRAKNQTSGFYEDLLTTTSGSLLKVQANTHDATGNDISSTVINSVRGLNTYIISNNNLGALGNITNNTTLTASTTTTTLDINNTYLNNSVFMYEDSSIALATGINIQVSTDNTNWMTIATLYPTVSESTKRTVSTNLKLKAFNYIRVLNIGVASYLNTTISLFSS